LGVELEPGQTLRLPQACVEAVWPGGGGERRVLAGLGSPADWEGGAAGWLPTPAGFRASAAPATLARLGVLSDCARVDLAVADPLPDLWLYLYTDRAALPAGDGYALHVGAEALTLERQTVSGAARAVGSCRLPGRVPGAPLEVSLTADLPRGRFRLATPAGPCGDWTDSGNPRPGGRGLLLVSYTAPAVLQQLAVTRLPAAAAPAADPSPTADRVVLTNGDCVEGALEAITPATWSVRLGAGRAPVRLPAVAVRQALFAAAAKPSGRRPGATVLLRQGSLLTSLSAVELRGDCLRVRCTDWGEADLPLPGLAEIRFAAP
jgi:hypothetical protein